MMEAVVDKLVLVGIAMLIPILGNIFGPKEIPKDLGGYEDLS